jgi:hypothetical protein
MKPVTSYRQGQLSLKEFYNLKYQEKLDYLNFLVKLPKDTRSNLDEHILDTFYKGNKSTYKFLEL